MQAPPSVRRTNHPRIHCSADIIPRKNCPGTNFPGGQKILREWQLQEVRLLDFVARPVGADEIFLRTRSFLCITCTLSPGGPSFSCVFLMQNAQFK